MSRESLVSVDVRRCNHGETGGLCKTGNANWAHNEGTWRMSCSPEGIETCHRRRSLLCSTTIVVVLMFSSTVALAACGGGSPSLGSTTTTGGSSNPSGASNSVLQQDLRYAQCMRSHAVTNFPDPTSSAGIPKETAQQLGVDESQLQAAQSDCKHLLPAGGSLSGQANQTITAEQQQYYLKVTTCMHSKGVTNFPEPSFFGGSVEFQGLGHLLGVQSPLFGGSFRICRKLIPSGLPYSSGPSG